MILLFYFRGDFAGELGISLCIKLGLKCDLLQANLNASREVDLPFSFIQSMQLTSNDKIFRNKDDDHQQQAVEP